MDSLEFSIILLCLTEVCLTTLWSEISLSFIILIMKLEGVTVGNNDN